MSIEEQLGVEEPAAIVESVEGARVAEVRRRVNKLIKASNVNTFDLAELLYEVKTKGYFSAWGFDSYSTYAKSLEIKYSKAYYLVQIVARMTAAGVSRAEYEQVGLAKLRVIATLDPETEFEGTPVVLLIAELARKAGQMSEEEVRAEVDRIKGKTGEQEMVWLNIHILKTAREDIAKPALALAKKHMAQTEDDDGNVLEASDGRALEMICANWLADVNFNNDLPVEEQRQNLVMYIRTLQGLLNAMPVQDPNQTDTAITDAIADNPEIPLSDLLIPSDETITKVIGEPSGE
jgi:hypothetical protein